MIGEREGAASPLSPRTRIAVLGAAFALAGLQTGALAAGYTIRLERLPTPQVAGKPLETYRRLREDVQLSDNAAKHEEAVR